MRYATNIEHDGECRDCADLERRLDKERGRFQEIENNMHSEIESLLSTVKRLQEENEQLTKERDYWRAGDNVKQITIRALKEHLTKLQEENKELVEFIKELANDYDDRVSPGFKQKAKELLKLSELNK